MADLTPFPDGIGFMEYAWDALSTVQEQALRYKAGQVTRPKTARPKTFTVLVAHGLLNDDWDISPRGRALLDWVDGGDPS